MSSAILHLVRAKGRTRPRKNPVPLGIRDLQREYLKKLLVLLNITHEEFSKIWPTLVTLGKSRHDEVRQDDWTDEINRIFSNLKEASDRANKIANDLAMNVLNGVNTRNRINFLRTMKASLGVDVFDNAQWRSVGKLFIQENVKLITSVPKRFLDDVEGVVLRNFQNGVRAENFRDEIEDRFGVSESRAALIARDQISKLNGSLNKERQTSIGIEHYFWRTSQDERVRDSHAELEGQRIAWDDPPDVGHPGEDVNCRCHPDPDVASIFEEME